MFLAACGSDDADPISQGVSGSESPTATQSAPSTDGTDASSTEVSNGDESGDKYGGTLRVALPADVIGFDIRARTDNPTLSVTELIFRPLVRLETDLSFQPDLATDWDVSEDATEFTFFLREGVTFHNGEVFNADDVVFTFESMLDPDFVSAKAGIYDGIKELTKVDDFTVKFTLTNPDAEFIDKLSSMGIVPNEYVAEVGDEEFNTHPIGTGPFQFVEWIPESRVVVERYEDYWDPELPYLDEVVFMPITEDSVRLASLESGEIDLWQRNVPAEHVERLQADERFVLEFKPFIYYHYISLNLDRVDAFQQKTVRQAIAYAIDRQAITDVIGYGSPGLGPISPVSPFFNPDLPYYTYDPEKAKQLLDEAGIDPSEISFTFQTFTYPDYQKVGELAFEMLKDIGFDVELKIDEWTIVRTKCYLPEASCDIHNSATGGLGPDAALYERFHSKGAENKQFYKNERVDELLDKGRATIDPKDRKEIYDEALGLILEDSPVIFVNDQDIPAIYWAYVKGFEINPWYSYMQLDRTWIDKDAKSDLSS